LFKDLDIAGSEFFPILHETSSLCLSDSWFWKKAPFSSIWLWLFRSLSSTRERRSQFFSQNANFVTPFPQKSMWKISHLSEMNSSNLMDNAIKFCNLLCLSRLTIVSIVVNPINPADIQGILPFLHISEDDKYYKDI
jgi:hypothetical protein